MRERFADHLILWLGLIFMLFPIWLLLLGAFGNDPKVLWPTRFELTYFRGLFDNGLTGSWSAGRDQNVWDMLSASFVMALGVATLKTLFSLLAAYALIFFRLPGRTLLFWLLLLPLFFPIESRLLPTFLTVSQLGLLNSPAGLVLPIVASGLGVLIFRGALLQLPRELWEAAKIDGAGPLRFFIDMVVPMSLPVIAGLFTILFVLGWNQYLWPIMVNTATDAPMSIVRGVGQYGVASQSGMALAVLAMIPPGFLMLLTGRYVIRGFALAQE